MLQLTDLSAGYSEVDIVKRISMNVESGEIVVVAGTNGSGKSTLVKAVMGFVQRTRGVLKFRGQNLLDLSVEERIAAGIAYVPQVANVFSSLSVIDNLRVVSVDKALLKRRIPEMFSIFPSLAERRNRQAGSLSGGERQQLAFARALVSEPQLLLLDEPTAALSPGLANQVFEMIQRMPSLGVAVLLIEQRARQALRICDRGYILDSGQVVLEGKASDILDNTEMTRLYLGQA